MQYTFFYLYAVEFNAVWGNSIVLSRAFAFYPSAFVWTSAYKASRPKLRRDYRSYGLFLQVGPSKLRKGNNEGPSFDSTIKLLHSTRTTQHTGIPYKSKTPASWEKKLPSKFIDDYFLNVYCPIL
jgi:hypothetical protein